MLILLISNFIFKMTLLLPHLLSVYKIVFAILLRFTFPYSVEIIIQEKRSLCI